MLHPIRIAHNSVNGASHPLQEDFEHAPAPGSPERSLPDAHSSTGLAPRRALQGEGHLGIDDMGRAAFQIATTGDHPADSAQCDGLDAAGGPRRTRHTDAAAENRTPATPYGERQARHVGPQLFPRRAGRSSCRLRGGDQVFSVAFSATR